MGHEKIPQTILALLGQFKTQLMAFLLKKAMRNLHQHAGTITHQGISTGRAAVLKIFKNSDTVFNDLVGLLALHIGNESKTTGRRARCGGRINHPDCCAVLQVLQHFVFWISDDRRSADR